MALLWRPPVIVLWYLCDLFIYLAGIWSAKLEALQVTLRESFQLLYMLEHEFRMERSNRATLT